MNAFLSRPAFRAALVLLILALVAGCGSDAPKKPTPAGGFTFMTPVIPNPGSPAAPAPGVPAQGQAG